MKKINGKDIERVKLAKFFGSHISSRQQIDQLRKTFRASKKAEIAVDFSGVEFISRSSAHELLCVVNLCAIFHGEVLSQSPIDADNPPLNRR